MSVFAIYCAIGVMLVWITAPQQIPFARHLGVPPIGIFIGMVLTALAWPFCIRIGRRP